MNWQAIGAVGELIGGIAVVLSLIYIAIQMRQNTRQIRENTLALQLSSRENAQQAFSRWRQVVIDSEMSDLYLRGRHDYEGLTRPERFRFGLVLQELLLSFEGIFQLVQASIYPRSRWEAAQGKALRALFGQPGARAWFGRNRHVFLPEFAAEVDRFMRSNDDA
jgi:hypothetical protein